MEYYIGVDGGGTKTQYALFNESKEMLDTVTTVGSNHENLEGSYDEAAEIIWSGITKLLRKNNVKPSQVVSAAMGLAGIDHEFQREEMYDRLSTKGIDGLEICNDGFLIIYAGIESGIGIGLNLGTGTCCNSIGSDLKRLQLGGFGEFSGDCGNGEWISQRTYAAIYSDVVLDANKTEMTSVFAKKAGLDETNLTEEIIETIPLLEGDRQDEFRIYLTDTFFECANDGDRVALEIMDYMADKCSDLLVAHTKRQTFDTDSVDVVLSGSMFIKTKSDLFIQKICENCFRKTGRKFNLNKLAVKPVVGCINALLRD